MTPRMTKFYMGIAHKCASMSRAERLKVGAVVVKDDNILSFSWNGTPAGWDNVCEKKEYMSADAGGWLSPEEIETEWPFVEEARGEEEPPSHAYYRRYRLVTKPEVLHAERNALDKLARSSSSAEGATLFTVYSPCVECAKSIYGAGIKRVVYQNTYRKAEGVAFLKQAGVEVTKIDPED